MLTFATWKSKIEKLIDGSNAVSDAAEKIQADIHNLSANTHLSTQKAQLFNQSFALENKIQDYRQQLEDLIMEVAGHAEFKALTAEALAPINHLLDTVQALLTSAIEQAFQKLPGENSDAKMASLKRAMRKEIAPTTPITPQETLPVASTLAIRSASHTRRVSFAEVLNDHDVDAVTKLQTKVTNLDISSV